MRVSEAVCVWITEESFPLVHICADTSSDQFLFPFILRAKTEGQGPQDIQGIEAPRCSLSLSLLRILSDVEKVSFVLGRVMLRSVASSKTGSVRLSLRTGKHSELFWLLGFLEVKLCDRRASDLKVGVRVVSSFCFFTKETFFIHGCRLHTGPLGLNRRYL